MDYATVRYLITKEISSSKYSHNIPASADPPAAAATEAGTV